MCKTSVGASNLGEMDARNRIPISGCALHDRRVSGSDFENSFQFSLCLLVDLEAAGSLLVWATWICLTWVGLRGNPAKRFGCLRHRRLVGLSTRLTLLKF